MSSQHPFQDLIATYALGALEGQDRRALEEHLEQCPHCRAELQEARALVDLLPRTVEPIQPSPETKRRLLARIQADLASRPDVRFYVAPSASDGAFRISLPWIVLLALGLLAVLAASALRAWWAGILIGVAVGLLVMRFRVTGRIDETRAARFVMGWALSVGVVILTGVALVPSVSHWNEEREIAAIMSSSDTYAWTMSGTGQAPQAIGKLTAVRGGNRGVLFVSGLGPLPEGKTYEFWLGQGSQMIPAGLFRVNADGQTWMLVTSDKDIHNYDKCGVTIEQKEGEPLPRGPILLKFGF